MGKKSENLMVLTFCFPALENLGALNRQHNNIRGVCLSGVRRRSSFPSISSHRPFRHPSIHPSSSSRKKKMMEESIYYCKEMGVGGLVRLFLIGWSPPSPHPWRAPAKVSGWWDCQHSGNQGKLKNILL
jgi:hypothetical protein